MSRFRRIDFGDSYGSHPEYVFEQQVQGTWTNQRQPRDNIVDASEYAYAMANYTTRNTICPHCKIGQWRQPIGIEFHSIGTFIQREAGRDRDFQRLLDVSKFTVRFNTFTIHHGSEPTWHEQLRWIAREAIISVSHRKSVEFSKSTILADVAPEASLRIMELIHAELCVEGGVVEFIQWACGDMVRPYPHKKLKTSDPCNVCGFNDPGDFAKWETVEQIHVMQDMGEEEIKIRFAAMRTFIERGFVAMVDKFWFAQDYLQEIGRHDYKMMMNADGSRLDFKAELRKERHLDNYIYEIEYLAGQFKNEHQSERMYNYNWFLGIPPGRMIMQPGNTKNGIKIFLTRFHIPALRTSQFLVDIRAKPNGIFDYFDSSDS